MTEIAGTAPRTVTASGLATEHHHVLVVGGGSGGISVAARLRRALGADAVAVGSTNVGVGGAAAQAERTAAPPNSSEATIGIRRARTQRTLNIGPPSARLSARPIGASIRYLTTGSRTAGGRVGASADVRAHATARP